MRLKDVLTLNMAEVASQSRDLARWQHFSKNPQKGRPSTYLGLHLRLLRQRNSYNLFIWICGSVNSASDELENKVVVWASSFPTCPCKSEAKNWPRTILKNMSTATRRPFPPRATQLPRLCRPPTTAMPRRPRRCRCGRPEAEEVS